MKEKKAVDWVLPVNQPYRVSSDASQHLMRSNIAGIDFYSTSNDKRIFSISDGKVVTAFWADPAKMQNESLFDSLGNFIIVRYFLEGRFIFARYCHLLLIKREAGAYVMAGDELGIMGSTGISTGPHLHLDFWSEEEDKAPGLRRVAPWPSAPILNNNNLTDFLLSKGIDCVNLGGAKWNG